MAALPFVPEEVTTIACNAAVDEFNGRPLDYYLLYDEEACRRHATAAYGKRVGGTVLVTLGRKSQRALEKRGLLDFDVFLTRVPAVKDVFFVRGEYSGNLALSGLHCLAFAVNNGAKEVIMLGLEGYEPWLAKVTLIIQPVTQAIIDACLDVEFSFIGSPTYKLTGDNLTFYGDGHAYQNAQAVQCT
jgi:hypothetical protein